MKVFELIFPAASAASLASAVLLSAVMSAPVYADDNASAGPGGLGQKVDTDNDGRVSRAEAQRSTTLKERFDALDTNHDGVLDAAQLAAPDSQAGARGTEVTP